MTTKTSTNNVGKRRKRRKTTLPDPVTLSTSYLDLLVSRLALRKKNRLELLTVNLVERFGIPTCLNVHVIDSMAHVILTNRYTANRVVIPCYSFDRSVYYNRIMEIQKFTYDLNTEVNYQTHDKNSPLRQFYERNRGL